MYSKLQIVYFIKMEEKKYYTEKDLIKFLGIKNMFDSEGKKEFPYFLNIEDLDFMWPRVVIPKGDIHEIVLAKIQDREYKGERKLKMLVELPYRVIKEGTNHNNKLGIISVEVGLTFRYDKEYKYGDINHSLAEVCYYIERNARETSYFYFIEDDTVFNFMSYYVIDNQWWIGKCITSSSVMFNYRNEERE